MKRLYFLVPNIKKSKGIVTELARMGIATNNIYVVGSDHAELEKHHLNEASVLQTTDLVHAIKQGVLAGVLVGLLAGFTLVSFPPAGLAIEGGSVLGMALFGAGFGAWASSLVGISIPNKIVEKYKSAVEKGEIMLLVDVPKAREAEITEQILKHHPKAEINDTEKLFKLGEKA